MEPNNLMDLGGGVSWFTALIIGALAGMIADKVMMTNHGILMNIVIGILGSIVGVFLADKLGLQLAEIFHGWFWGNLIVSAVGAVVLLAILKLIRGR